MDSLKGIVQAVTLKQKRPIIGLLYVDSWFADGIRSNCPRQTLRLLNETRMRKRGKKESCKWMDRGRE